MKKKFLSLGFIIIFALGAVLSGCGGGSSTNAGGSEGSGGTDGGEKTFELNLGHTLAPDSHYHVMATKLAELAKEKSGGTINISVFPQSQLGGEVQMIQAARTGTLGMLITAQAPLTNTIPEYSIFDLPYLFDSIDQANKVLSSPVGQKFLDMLPKHGLVGLGFLSAIERDIVANKPIDSVDDMKAFKIRVMQAPGYVKAYEALGAQPTPMAYAEVYLSLQQGVVDGADTSPDQVIMDKFVEVSKYFNKTKVHYLPPLLIISKAKWDELSENQQKALQEAAKEALAYGIEYYKKSYDESIEKMKQIGVTVVEPDLAPFKETAKKVYDELLKDIPNGQQLLEEIEAAKKQ